MRIMWPFRSLTPQKRRFIVEVGLYQLAVAATGFAAWRVLSSPSTLAFFVLELGATLALGIFLAWRHGENSPALPASADRNAGPSERELPRLNERAGSFSELLRDGKRLVSLAKSTGQDLGSYLTRTKRAWSYAKAGRAGRAVRIQRHNNAALRRALDNVARRGRGVPPSFAKRVFLSLSALFFLLVAAGIWFLSTSLYVPSTLFYLTMGIAGAALAPNIYLNGGRRGSSLIAEIVVLGALVKFAFYYLNPYVYSADVFVFFAGLQGFATTGYLPASLGYYQFFPALATYASAAVGVAGVPLGFYGIFAYAAETATIPLVYLVGRQVADRRVGLFAALLYVFTVFTFLETWYTPSYFGMLFLFLAIYAVTRMQPGGSAAWFAIFWVAALGTLFAHPIDALILALVLAIRFVTFLASKDPAASRGAAGTPALSYAVVYGTYLAFIALTTFEIFVRSFVATGGGAAPLATTPGVTLQSSAYYAVQSAIAPLGVTLPMLFVGYAIFTQDGFVQREHAFFRLLWFGFLAIPAIEVFSESFGLQSARFLLYLAIPLVLLGAQGLTSLARRMTSPRRIVAFLVALFLILGFAASSSYLTFNDERTIYSAVPAVPTHVTASALANRAFLELGENGSTVYMDFGSSRYLGNSVRSADSLVQYDTPLLDGFNGSTPGAFVLINNDYLAYGSAYQGAFYNMTAVQAILQDSQASLIYDSGVVQTYMVP